MARKLAAIFIAILAIASPSTAQSKLDSMPKVDWNKRVVFAQSGKSWSEVLGWFADQADLPFVDLFVPAGNFVDATCYATRSREYSLIEIYDVLNRELQSRHKLTILRGDVSISLMPVGGEIPRQRMPRVLVAELKDLPRTEIVEVVVGLASGQDGEEFVERLKATSKLGPFGGAIPISNTVIM